jgi:uncharacterized membrane protein HdeD (DUF308 family)
MFREIRFYDDYTAAVAAPWWMFCLQGLNFLLLGALILIFPHLLPYLVACFFIFAGTVQLVIAWQFRRFKKLYRLWRESLWLP